MRRDYHLSFCWNWTTVCKRNRMGHTKANKRTDDQNYDIADMIHSSPSTRNQKRNSEALWEAQGTLNYLPTSYTSLPHQATFYVLYGRPTLPREAFQVAEGTTPPQDHPRLEGAQLVVGAAYAWSTLQSDLQNLVKTEIWLAPSTTFYRKCTKPSGTRSPTFFNELQSHTLTINQCCWAASIM